MTLSPENLLMPPKTIFLGGIMGGVLAIPLTAALRTAMFRYVWKDRVHSSEALAA